MGKINVLSDDIVNKISAGEVIERPASAIKELLENSIDANANNIEIELHNAGMKKIEITDNGTGIEKDDLQICLHRHTTSKISRNEDLFLINSLGFRGEALASIASVANVSITSKTKDSETAYRIISNFGEISKLNELVAKKGTKITVENLYQNTPARLKFLKTKQTELSHVLSVVNNLALTNKNINFKLNHENNNIIFYPATSSFIDRFNKVLKNNAKWLEHYSEHSYLNANIFILDPKISKKKDYKVFVNNRIVNDKVIYHALNSAFDKFTSSGNYNTVILFINIDPSFVDVNVSPSKSEVRFREASFVHDFVYNLCSNVFKEPDINIVSFENLNNEKNIINNLSCKNYSKNKLNFNNNNFANINSIDNHYNNKKNNYYNDINKIYSYRKIFGQYKSQYVLFEAEDKLIILDQHAAHERINFEKILKNLNEQKQVQTLLIPEIFETNYEDSLNFDKFIPKLTELGFDIDKEEQDNILYIIRAVPKVLANIDLSKLFYELLKKTTSEDFKNKLSFIAAPLSCHSSIRGATNLSDSEIKELLSQLDKCQFPYTCPHGRPIKIEFTLYEIEKLFRRK